MTNNIIKKGYGKLEEEESQLQADFDKYLEENSSSNMKKRDKLHSRSTNNSTNNKQ